MKKSVPLILFCCLYLNGFSQSNIRINDYWENTYYINPASIYSEYQFVASGAARQQWIGFPGAPNTEYMTFAARLYTNRTHETQIGQIGIKVYHDKIGFTNLTNISPSFSYSLRLYNDWRLNLGFAYKIQNFNYDMSKSNLEAIGDPATYITESKWSNQNVDLGIELVANSFLFGASSQNLVSLFTNNNGLQTNANFLYGMKRFEFDRFFNFLMGICAINNVNVYQGEFNFSVLSNLHRGPNFQMGVFYRTASEIGALFGIDLNKNVRLACSYDYHVGGISHSSVGTPEILLVWKFDKLENCDCGDLFK